MAERSVGPAALVFGTVYLVLGVGTMLADIDGFDEQMAWVWAAALAVLGLGGIVVTLRGARRS